MANSDDEWVGIEAPPTPGHAQTPRTSPAPLQTEQSSHTATPRSIRPHTDVSRSQTRSTSMDENDAGMQGGSWGQKGKHWEYSNGKERNIFENVIIQGTSEPGRRTTRSAVGRGGRTQPSLQSELASESGADRSSPLNLSTYKGRRRSSQSTQGSAENERIRGESSSGKRGRTSSQKGKAGTIPIPEEDLSSSNPLPTKNIRTAATRKSSRRSNAADTESPTTEDGGAALGVTSSVEQYLKPGEESTCVDKGNGSLRPREDEKKKGLKITLKRNRHSPDSQNVAPPAQTEMGDEEDDDTGPKTRRRKVDKIIPVTEPQHEALTPVAASEEASEEYIQPEKHARQRNFKSSRKASAPQTRTIDEDDAFEDDESAPSDHAMSDDSAEDFQLGHDDEDYGEKLRSKSAKLKAQSGSKKKKGPIMHQSRKSLEFDGYQTSEKGEVKPSSAFAENIKNTEDNAKASPQPTQSSKAPTTGVFASTSKPAQPKAVRRVQSGMMSMLDSLMGGSPSAPRPPVPRPQHPAVSSNAPPSAASTPNRPASHDISVSRTSKPSAPGDGSTGHEQTASTPSASQWGTPIDVKGAKGEHVTPEEMRQRRIEERHENAHPRELFDLLEGAEIMMEFEEETRSLMHRDQFLIKNKLYKPGRTEGASKLAERIREERKDTGTSPNNH